MNIRTTKRISCLISLYAVTGATAMVLQNPLPAPPLSRDNFALLHRNHPEKHMYMTCRGGYIIAGLYNPTNKYPVILSANYTTLYAGLQNNTIVRCPIKADSQRETIFSESKPIKAIALSHNEQIIASSACSNSIKLWNTQTKQLLHILDAHHATVESLTFNTQNTILASSHSSGEILLWDVSTGNLLHRIDAHTLPFGKIAFSPDGTILAATDCVTVDSESNTTLWEAATGRQLHVLRNNNNQEGGSIAFDPCNPIIAIIKNNCSVALYNTCNGEECALLTEHVSPITDIAYSHDGSLLSSISIDGSIAIWSSQTNDRQSKRYDLHCYIRNHLNSYPSNPKTDEIYTAITFSHDDSKLIIHKEDRHNGTHTVTMHTIVKKD